MAMIPNIDPRCTISFGVNTVDFMLPNENNVMKSIKIPMAIWDRAVVALYPQVINFSQLARWTELGIAYAALALVGKESESLHILETLKKEIPYEAWDAFTEGGMETIRKWDDTLVSWYKDNWPKFKAEMRL